MELRVTKFDDALAVKLRILAAKAGKSIRQVIIDLVREATQSTK